MKTLGSIVPHGSRAAAAARRIRLLAEFDRSGLTAATFARKRGLRYTTFRGWLVLLSRSFCSVGQNSASLAEVFFIASLGGCDVGNFTALKR